MVMYAPETPKGFPEFLPPESQRLDKVKKIVQGVYEKYGFLPIRTPTIEFDELMRPDTQSNDEAISDRFRLQDRGGRNLGLRYEFTFQLARIFRQNPNIKLPLRIFQIGSNFRDEPTGGLRFREFVQCDADIIGDSSITAEAECLAMASEVMRELGIEAVIHVNSRRLMNAILDSVQINNKREVLKEIDKMDKLGEDEVKSSLKKYADANQILTLFKLMEKSLDFFVGNLFDGAEDLKKLSELGKIYGFKFKFDPFIMRGFSYYTGNIFEIKLEGAKESLGGGGRYDKVVGKFLGHDIPAFGVSFGLERIALFAKIPLDNIKALVISLNEEKEAIKIVQSLRKNKISAIISTDKVGKAMEYANSYKIENVIFIGSEEVNIKKFKIKNMESGKEKYVTEKQLIKELK